MCWGRREEEKERDTHTQRERERASARLTAIFAGDCDEFDNVVQANWMHKQTNKQKGAEGRERKEERPRKAKKGQERPTDE